MDMSWSLPTEEMDQFLDLLDLNPIQALDAESVDKTWVSESVTVL